MRNYLIDGRSTLCKNFRMQLSFSEMQPDDVAPRTGIRPARPGPSQLSISELSEQAGRYLQHAHAESTARCYARDWAQFE